MSNHITITGRATGDCELRWTASGKAVGTFTLADNHRKKTQSGEWVDDGATFLRVTVWDHLAEECAEKVTKAAIVSVSGTLRQREWEKDGEKRTSYEVTAQEVALPLPKFAPREQQSGGQYQRPSQAQQPADDPWGSAPAQSDSIPF